MSSSSVMNMLASRVQALRLLRSVRVLIAQACRTKAHFCSCFDLLLCQDLNTFSCCRAFQVVIFWVVWGGMIYVRYVGVVVGASPHHDTPTVPGQTLNPKPQTVLRHYVLGAWTTQLQSCRSVSSSLVRIRAGLAYVKLLLTPLPAALLVQELASGPGQGLVTTRPGQGLVKAWSRAGQALVKHWSSSGLVKPWSSPWSSPGQALVKAWSSPGQALVKPRSRNFSPLGPLIAP